MGYRGTWNSTDQLPARAVDNGDIASADMDASTRSISSSGGETYRYSLSADLQRTTTRGTTKYSVFGAAYGLDLSRISRSSSTIPSMAISSSRRTSGSCSARASAIAGSIAGPGATSKTPSALNSVTTRSARSACIAHARGSGCRRFAKTVSIRRAAPSSRRIRFSGRRRCARRSDCAAISIAST